MPTEMELTLEQTQQGVSISLEHAEFDESNTHVLERFYTSAGNPVKEILLKLNLPDHRKLKDGGEGPFLARRLAWRRVSHRSSDCHSSLDFTSDSSSSSSSSDSSSNVSSGSSSDSYSNSSLVHSSDSSLGSSSERSLDSSSPSAGLSQTIADLGIGDGVGAPTEDGIGMRVKVTTSDIREDEKDFEVEASAGGTMEIAVDPLVTGGISESTGGDALDLEEVGQLERERVGLVDRVRILGRENLRVRALLYIERDRVDSLRRHMALSQEEFCQVHRDRDETRRRLRRLESLVERRLGFSQALETREANRNIGLGNGNDKGGNENGTEGVFGLISALTWWNSHKRTIRTDAAFSMSLRELMKLMDEVYCPRNEIQKMESELWNLTVKNNDLTTYTQRFQELTMLCTKMVPEEEDRVEKFIGGLPDNIQGNVIAAEPTRLQDAVRMANNLMDQKLKGYAMKNDENKRKFDNNQKDNRRQQPPFKRQNVRGHNVARAYTAGNNERRVYNEPLPLCNKSRGKAYVLGGGDANLDSNVVTGMFLLNNHYASVLFDSEDDQSFVSTIFSTLLDIIPDTLDVSYAVELADRRTSKTNTVLRGSNHHAVIVYDEKIVWIPYGDEVLIVQGDRCGKGKNSKLSIISCTKTHKYIKKGCLIFLAQVTKKETEDKSKEKPLEDVPTVRDFPKVIPKDFPGLPAPRKVEFQFDLVSGDAPVA
ncbi:putative reverse transcriptase domain-containing protein [Tanacetum coccineum]